jgi:hypothetical protein
MDMRDRKPQRLEKRIALYGTVDDIRHIMILSIFYEGNLPPLEVVAAKNLGALFFSASEYSVRD